MKKVHKDEVVRDEQGRVVYESRSDGFEETTTYSESGKIIKVDTIYPNGIREVEQFADN